MIFYCYFHKCLVDRRYFLKFDLVTFCILNNYRPVASRNEEKYNDSNAQAEKRKQLLSDQILQLEKQEKRIAKRNI